MQGGVLITRCKAGAADRAHSRRGSKQLRSAAARGGARRGSSCRRPSRSARIPAIGTRLAAVPEATCSAAACEPLRTRPSTRSGLLSSPLRPAATDIGDPSSAESEPAARKLAAHLSSSRQAHGQPQRPVAVPWVSRMRQQSAGRSWRSGATAGGGTGRRRRRRGDQASRPSLTPLHAAGPSPLVG